MRSLLARLAALLRHRRLDRELDEEVAFHLSMLEQEYVAAGMPPAEAKLAARREFGGVAQIREKYRETRGIPWLETTLQDIRYAVRGLRRNPGFTAAAVASLALGIGANTTIFSLYHALMLRPLPIAKPGELLSLRLTDTRFVQLSHALFSEVAARTDLFSGVIAHSSVGRARFGRTGFVATEGVTVNYFRVLGITPAAGRLFADSDCRSNPRVTVLSYDYWRRAFGGNPNVIGRIIDGYEVLGVAAPEFRGIDLDWRTDQWRPIGCSSVDPRFAETGFAEVLARRRPAVTVARVQSALDVLLNRHNQELYKNPADAYRPRAMKQKFLVRPAGTGLSQVREQFGKPLTILMATVGLVLLAACANVAGLLIARAQARRREAALRLSLGAARSRIVRQALTECALLAALGCASGLVIAFCGRSYVLHFLPADIGDPFGDAFNRSVLAFVAGVSALAALLSGLGPAWRSTAVDPAATLRREPERGRRRSLGSGLVVAQVAFSVVLALAATLFGTSLAKLRLADQGFTNHKVISFMTVLGTREDIAARKSLLAKIETLPGVSSVATSQFCPTGRTWAGTPREVRVPGSEKTARAEAPVDQQDVSDSYFHTLGTPLLHGREFSRAEADSESRYEMAIVNDAFVQEFMPGEANPVGRTIYFSGRQTRILGVVPNIAHKGLREAPEPVVYRPMPFYGAGYCVLIAAKNPEALLPGLRREVSNLSMSWVSEPTTLERQMDEAIYQDRLLAGVSGLFGILALLLAAVGLYGAVAYDTAHRTGEIGIRVALGAGRLHVLWITLSRALLLVAVGLLIGIPTAAIVARGASTIVFGVKPDDPWLYAVAAMTLFSAGALAAFLPARRAAALDPMQALRHE